MEKYCLFENNCFKNLVQEIYCFKARLHANDWLGASEFHYACITSDQLEFQLIIGVTQLVY